MNNPGQYLIHLTSRGPKVFNQGQAGSVGLFKCMVQQPLKDINKFGLLHYSIPKTLDTLQPNNNLFYVTLTFGNGNDHRIPVRIPLLDYYNATVSQEHDTYRPANQNIRSRKNSLIGFDEVLQTAINWSIQDYFARGAPVNNAPSQQASALARISCIVEFNQAFGTYKFTFGFRGSQTVANANTGQREYNAGTQADSGCPFPSAAQGAIAINTGVYRHRDVRGVVRVLPRVNAVAFLEDIHLQSVAFEDMSLRLQLMLGASHASLISSLQKNRWDMVTRGRIRLVNYETNIVGAVAPNMTCGMIELSMSIPPNLAPPAMIYLQLQVPGTKTKILGQSDERGGWAVPTPPNGFMSRYLNFPNNSLFSPYSSRTLPKIAMGGEADYLAFYANDDPNNLVESGYMYDPIPIGAPNNQVREVDNFDCTNHATGSRMIMFGVHRGLTPAQSIQNPQAGAIKRFDTDGRNFLGASGFGKGIHRNAQVFTASMISPNWVYTNTQDSTIQTFDIQLLWGDTSDAVDAIVGNPVQFSIIASP